MSEPWYRTPHALFQHPLEFFPARDMDPAQRLNALVRFIAYSSIFISLYRDDLSMLGVGSVVILVISFIFAIPTDTRDTTPNRNNKSYDAFANIKCSAPTPENPFMNVLANEYGSNKPAACANTPETMAVAQSYFDQGLPREISDVYHNRASDRQFVTMPVTGPNGIPDTVAFRNFLFSQTARGTKCK